MAVQLPGSGFGTSSSACAGAASAYLLRLLSEKTGCRPSATAERLLHQLATPDAGATIGHVEGWYRANSGLLAQLGFRVVIRRVALKTPWILDWVGKGKGFRGAVLETSRRRLHGPSEENRIAGRHAVGLGVEERGRKHQLIMVDPWPFAEPVSKPPPTLEAAHRAAKYASVVIHWTGWR